jgi:hypothetical protein
MEAPTAYTTKPILEEIIDIKEYTINLKELQFKIQIGKIKKELKNLINFKVEELNSNSNTFYQSSFSLDDLKNISKLFRVYDSIEEAYNELIEILNDKKIFLELNINDIIIHLNITNLSSKLEDVALIIKNQSKSIDKSYDSLINEINELKKKSFEKDIQQKQWKENIENQIKELKKENLELKKEIEELKQWKQNTENELKQYQQKIQIEKKIDSKIINSNDEINLLSNRLKKNNQNKKVVFNLIYRASRDGDSPNDYHKKCDGKINTLCIIQTIKGIKFGGYTETIINDSGDNIDSNAFVFSLDKMKIYENLKKNECAVGHFKNWGPIFRRDAFAIWNQNFFSYNKHTLGSKNQSNFGIMDIDNELNNGETYFTVRELEVFQIFLE